MADELQNALRKASLREVEVAGVKLHVRGLTSRERMELVRMQKDGTVTDFQVAFWGLAKPDGSRYFDSVEDAAESDGALIAEIAMEVMRASKLLPDADEDAVKN